MDSTYSGLTRIRSEVGYENTFSSGGVMQHGNPCYGDVVGAEIPARRELPLTVGLDDLEIGEFECDGELVRAEQLFAYELERVFWQRGCVAQRHEINLALRQDVLLPADLIYRAEPESLSVNGVLYESSKMMCFATTRPVSWFQSCSAFRRIMR